MEDPEQKKELQAIKDEANALGERKARLLEAIAAKNAPPPPPPAPPAPTPQVQDPPPPVPPPAAIRVPDPALNKHDEQDKGDKTKPPRGRSRTPRSEREKVEAKILEAKKKAAESVEQAQEVGGSPSTSVL